MKTGLFFTLAFLALGFCSLSEALPVSEPQDLTFFNHFKDVTFGFDVISDDGKHNALTLRGGETKTLPSRPVRIEILGFHVETPAQGSK